MHAPAARRGEGEQILQSRIVLQVSLAFAIQFQSQTQVAPRKKPLDEHRVQLPVVLPDG
jgi:hypothetical protein